MLRESDMVTTDHDMVTTDHDMVTTDHDMVTVGDTRPSYRPSSKPTVMTLLGDPENFSSNKSSSGDRPQSIPEKEGTKVPDQVPPGFQPGDVTEVAPWEAEAILTFPRDAWFQVYVMGEKEEEVKRVSQETGMPLEKLKEIRLRAWEKRMAWIAGGRKNLER
jgi:hypothetical protein